MRCNPALSKVADEATKDGIAANSHERKSEPAGDMCESAFEEAQPFPDYADQNEEGGNGNKC